MYLCINIFIIFVLNLKIEIIVGYRTYIAEMPKREYNKIKSLTREGLIEHLKLEVDEDENYLGIGVYDFGKTLYEFGKYTDFEPPKKSLKTFFKNKELNKYFTKEHDFNIVTAEFLEYIIDGYARRIETYYNDMIMPFFNKGENKYRDNPKDFLNSVETEYNYPNNKHTFDFSKITPEEQTSLFKIIEHIRSFRQEWNDYRPYNLKHGDEVSNSCKYEYAIFQLVKIYKSFDWKRNVMIYYGY